MLRGYAATSPMLRTFSPPSLGRAFGVLSFHSVVCKQMHLGGLLVGSAGSGGTVHPHPPGLDGLLRQNRRQMGGKVTTEQRTWRRLPDSRGRGRRRGEEGLGGLCSDV